MIELLVVVSIIALLVSMLLPALNKAKEQARAIYCCNNTKIICTGLNQYVTEWSTYPFSCAEAYYGTLPAGTTWDDNLSPRWALGCLSYVVGGPKGTAYDKRDSGGGDGCMYNLQPGEFARVYVCPSADKTAVYKTNTPTGTDFHASYWTNPAIRVNRGIASLSATIKRNRDGKVAGLNGWALCADLSSNNPPDPADDTNSGGAARFYGYVCPKYNGPHWRSVYHPRPDTVRNPNGMAFIGDTNNVQHQRNGGHLSPPGDWAMGPGVGWVESLLGFERHGDKVQIGYVDGHARSMPKAEAVNTNTNYGHFYTGETTGDPWMVKYVGEDGCGNGIYGYKHPMAACVIE